MMPGWFVYIIESPSSRDLLNGTMEGKALLESLRLAEIPCSHNLVIDIPMLEISLKEKLYEDWERLGKRPLLHFSMHGTENGIGLSNGDFVTWEELWKLLTPIAHDMEGGLIICMSTCFGSYGAYMAKFAQSSLTYGALIGNTSKTKWSDSAVGYITFYHQFFRGLLFADQCVEAMKIASGDDGFKLHWGHEVGWKLRKLEARGRNYETSLSRIKLG